MSEHNDQRHTVALCKTFWFWKISDERLEPDQSNLHADSEPGADLRLENRALHFDTVT